VLADASDAWSKDGEQNKKYQIKKNSHL